MRPVDRIEAMYFVTYVTYVTRVTFSQETMFQVTDSLALTGPTTRHQDEALLHVQAGRTFQYPP